MLLALMLDQALGKHPRRYIVHIHGKLIGDR
jgi:hypothetical protein